MMALANAPSGSPVRLTCGQRDIGGFPFELVLTCRDPAFAVAGDSGPVDIRFPQLSAKASLFAPQTVEVDLAGPLTAIDARGRTNSTWTTMHLDIVGLSRDVRRVAVHGTGLNLSCSGCYEALRSSQVGTFDVSFEQRGDTRDYAFAVSASALQNALLAALTGTDEPAIFAANGTVTQFDWPRSLRLAAEAERWRAAGGSLTVERASLDQGAMHTQVAGTFALDPFHRSSGTFQFGARNAAALVSVFTRSLSPLLQLAIGAALRGIDSATAQSGEKLDVSLPGRIDNGSVSLGPLRGISSVAPLY